MDIHRWLTEKKPVTLASASRLADEFAVLYKPFKVESFGESKYKTRVDVDASNRNSRQF